LGWVRDRVIDAANLQRHHVVLDLNAGSGLLTWELLRRTPEGGTWALARERQAGEGLRQQIERWPKLSQPVVLVGDPDELSELLDLRGEGELRFDAILGRNALGKMADKAACLRLLKDRLHPGSPLSLAETVPRDGQRLISLLDLSSLDDDLQHRLVEAEEEIYANPDNPFVNWDSDGLRESLVQAGFEDLSTEDVDQEAELLVSQAAVDRWFELDTGQEQPSYAQYLLRYLEADELAVVRALFERQLVGETVNWRSRIVFVVGYNR
jgi:putative ATPase